MFSVLFLTGSTNLNTWIIFLTPLLKYIIVIYHCLRSRSRYVHVPKLVANICSVSFGLPVLSCDQHHHHVTSFIIPNITTRVCVCVFYMCSTFLNKWHVQSTLLWYLNISWERQGRDSLFVAQYKVSFMCFCRRALFLHSNPEGSDDTLKPAGDCRG